jgi:hypothetical protein
MRDRIVKVQILDPATAFELEGEIVDRLGDQLSLTLAAPEHVLGSLWKHVAGETGLDFTETVTARDRGLAVEVGADFVIVLLRALTSEIADTKVDPQWLASTWRKCVLGRVQFDGRHIDVMSDWSRLKLGPLAKWHVLTAQLRATFAPLWLRSPYTFRPKVQDFGVPEPTSVPMAVRWANEITRLGHGSTDEIIRKWTPVRLIEVVEAAAFTAERERRQIDATRPKPKAGR